MKLNMLSPARGSRKTAKRVGRGIGSTLGKTSGKGHKGQLARAGAPKKKGFEGGQMPLQRRLPKMGFVSRKNGDEIRLHELNRFAANDVINLESLRKAKLIGKADVCVKIIDSGAVDRALKIAAEIKVTKGAKKAIEDAGGEIGV